MKRHLQGRFNPPKSRKKLLCLKYAHLWIDQDVAISETFSDEKITAKIQQKTRRKRRNR